jgi:hypothetical protein
MIVVCKQAKKVFLFSIGVILNTVPVSWMAIGLTPVAAVLTIQAYTSTLTVMCRVKLKQRKIYVPSNQARFRLENVTRDQLRLRAPLVYSCADR